MRRDRVRDGKTEHDWILYKLFAVFLIPENRIPGLSKHALFAYGFAWLKRDDLLLATRSFARASIKVNNLIGKLCTAERLIRFVSSYRVIEISSSCVLHFSFTQRS